jgi:FtsP/CotA-like multicopper oxidase with cupredoxin domain
MLAGGAALGIIPVAGWQLSARARQVATPEGSPQVPGHDPAGTTHDHMATPTAGPAQTPIADPLAYGFIPAEAFANPPERASQDSLLDTSLTAAFGPATVASREVTTLTCDGSLPEPTLRVQSGDTIKLRAINGFDEPTNFHTHGFPISPSGNSDNVFVDIEPGSSFDYQFDRPDDHPPGTYQYYPHFHGHTRRQVALGLAGVIVNDGIAALAPALGDLPTKIMGIQSPQFDTTGTVLPTGLPLPIDRGQ